MHRVLRLGPVLLGAFLGWSTEGQAADPGAALTPEVLSRLCAATTPCTVPVTAHRTLALSGDWHLPRSMHLRFGAGSALAITGGVLHFDGGSVEAPANEGIFPDPDRVRGLPAARPEWFAAGSAGDGRRSNRAPLPEAALAAAYQATEPWGAIYLQARNYLSPFSSCSAKQVSYSSPRTLVGAGRPTPDNLRQPTHLQGGTVLLGGIEGTAPVRLASLGIDVGPRVSAAELRGCTPPGVFITRFQQQPTGGDRVQDVSVLSTGAMNMHTAMIEGHDGVEIRGLWIWSLGGTHGLVLKSGHSVVDGLHCWGAAYDCLIVKSDYATDLLGKAAHDRITHVDIQPLTPEGAVGGIVVDGRWDSVQDLDMEDIRESRARFPIILVGSTFFRPQAITIRNWTAEGVYGICLFSDKADAVQVSGFQCTLLPGAQAGVVLRGGRGTQLRDGTIRCDGTPAHCAEGHMDGIDVDAAGTSLDRITAIGLNGYLVRSTHGSPANSTPADLARSGLQTVDMNGRISERYRVPLRTRLLDLQANGKPNLRILYTATVSRVQLHPGLYGTVCGLLIITIASEVVYRRRRTLRARRVRYT